MNSINAPVAQLVEHLTFNQGVRSSILRRSTKGLITSVLSLYRDVAQLVARVLWEHDVAGSNPVIPTKKVVSYWIRLFLSTEDRLWQRCGPEGQMALPIS